MGKQSKGKRSTNKIPCYHGCTKKEFNNCGELYKVLEDWDKAKTEEERIEFYETHKRVMVAPSFGNFVIAHVTDDYLKGKDDDILLNHLVLLLDMRYLYIPSHEGKDVGPESVNTTIYHKYIRDINTERGRINCMAREIPCDCMEEKRIEAKSMEKLAMCFGCRKDFLKEKILRCKGCNHAQYCSEACSEQHWATHKEYCKKFGVSSAPTPEPLSSPFGKPSDVDDDV